MTIYKGHSFNVIYMICFSFFNLLMMNNSLIHLINRHTAQSSSICGLAV